MKTMCGGLFSFCFLHDTVFGNGQVAITHNWCVYAAPHSGCRTRDVRRIFFNNNKNQNLHMTILLILIVALLAWAISDNGKANQRFLEYREREARDFEK